MAYEVEMKVYLENKEYVVNLLTNIGCSWEKEKVQYDRIFYKKDMENQELFFRIRNENNVNYILTLKQILNEVEVVEFESSISDPNEVMKMILKIGFKEYVTINKSRMEGKVNNFSVCVDNVEGLGDFLEVEKIVLESCERDDAKRELEMFLFSLGIKTDRICKKRYHTMICELQKNG